MKLLEQKPAKEKPVKLADVKKPEVKKSAKKPAPAAKKTAKGATKRTAKRSAKSKSERSKGRTGRFTYFPDKTVTRSWRVTKSTDDLLRKVGEELVDDQRVDPQTGEARRVGATDVLETLVQKFASKLTMNDVRRVSKGES